MAVFLNRRMSLRLLTLAAAVSLLGCSPKSDTASVTSPVVAPAAGSGPLKIGFVYVGPVGDAGWTYAHDLGRKAIEEKFGDKVKTTFVENVAEGADSERVFRDLAAQGNTLIFGTTFGYMEPMLKVAKDFPAVSFQHATGYKTAGNMGVYDAHTYEGAYLAGVVAGKMTKSNKLGVVASIPIPEVIRNINAFTLGAQSSNPAVTTRVVWINKWFDPGKEREGALALIGQGVDVLIQNTDSPATLQAAEEKGVYAFGWDSDMSKVGPKAHLASAAIDWAPYYTKVVTEALAGPVKSDNSWWGVKEGAIVMASINASLPADVRTLLDQKTAAIKDGTLTPFQGPVVDQAGKEMVAAGQTMAIKDMKGLNYYVKGVDGSIPK
ncbi:BMP family ABC transporter substrate-binding protein [Actimicrobium sp. CCC2.4]|uniref:BMP family ABC transporter substrate-binding protein n=1 Tax=Actimicrobium sp. CCC2.4 TaxID=3048606 RepID=UPI002AC96DD9|nr:BMP family ABC transporter substrate-binding protein [Actimicrobium sp. CCC2.4]MEB0135610.1 BMP family ABC transporter substrate-binding protein [Actimicrobium sp. CCC2.4]WPX33828.1 BMP family ABC transporter substrate-binding protein [Actimicrobium sp. CCC2.4]